MTSDHIEYLQATIPALEKVDRITKLDKGFSPDAKFIAWQQGTPRFLIRLAEVERRVLLQAEFDILVPCYKAEIPCPKPVAWGITADKRPVI